MAEQCAHLKAGWSTDQKSVIGINCAYICDDQARVYLGLCWVVNPCKVSYVAENVQGHQVTSHILNKQYKHIAYIDILEGRGRGVHRMAYLMVWGRLCTLIFTIGYGEPSCGNVHDSSWECIMMRV